MQPNNNTVYLRVPTVGTLYAIHFVTVWFTCILHFGVDVSNDMVERSHHIFQIAILLS